MNWRSSFRNFEYEFRFTSGKDMKWSYIGLWRRSKSRFVRSPWRKFRGSIACFRVCAAASSTGCRWGRRPHPHNSYSLEKMGNGNHLLFPFRSLLLRRLLQQLWCEWDFLSERRKINERFAALSLLSFALRNWVLLSVPPARWEREK